MLALLAAATVFSGQVSVDAAPAKSEYVLAGCTRHQKPGDQPAQKDMKKDNAQKKAAS